MIPCTRFGLAWAVSSLLVAAAMADTNTVEFFGLSHTPLGAATVEIDGRLQVANISTNGQDGVRTELGVADAGVFLYPDTSNVRPGYLMRASAYGRVNGQSNSLIASIYGYRAEYAEFFAGADYSPIGATNLTFQLWNGSALVAETTVTNGEVFMYGEYASPPRVNPWWREANGDYGELIEFSYPLPVSLPGFEGDINGNRIFIRPNGATSVVEYVSRTDVFGDGGLDHFFYNQMRLGVFGRPHLALNTKLVALPGSLTLDGIMPGEEQGGGVFVEWQPALRTTVNLLPVDIAIPNTNGTRHRLEMSASGSRDGYLVNIGSLFLSNSNGVLELLPYVYEDEMLTVEVLSNNVPVGSNVVARSGPPLRIEGAPRVSSFEATADTLASRVTLGLAFDTNATITFSNGTQLIGNSIVARISQWLRFADISAMAVNAYEIPSFTIVGETTEPAVAPQLEIYRAGTNVVLRWPDPAQAYRLVSKTNVAETFYFTFEPSYSNGTATIELTPQSRSEAEFFRLQRNTAPFYD